MGKGLAKKGKKKRLSLSKKEGKGLPGLIEKGCHFSSGEKIRYVRGRNRGHVNSHPQKNCLLPQSEGRTRLKKKKDLHRKAVTKKKVNHSREGKEKKCLCKGESR